MRTLFPSYRVGDLERSLAFYTAVGYRVLGRVPVGEGSTLALLAFPEEAAATLELVHRPSEGPVELGGFDHLAVQVDDLSRTLRALERRGLRPGPLELPAGEDGPRTAWLADPDGSRIELVEWPPGHEEGITAADFAAEEG